MEKRFWSADANAGIVTVKNWDGQETTVSLLIVLQAGGSPRKCQSTMPKRSWRNGARLLGSKKREGNDDLPNAQSDGVPRRAQERGIYASILERSSTLCGEQDAKSDS